MIVQSVKVYFVGSRIGLESYSHDGGLGVVNGWATTLDGSASPEDVGTAALEGLDKSEQDYTAPSMLRDGAGSPAASALGMGNFDDLIRAGAHAVSVVRRGDVLKVQAATTHRLSFGATKENWKTLLDASSDALTLGGAILEARVHCRTEP